MKIIMLASDCNSTQAIYNEINKEFNVSKLIIEQPISLLTLAKKRVKRIGYFQVFGQIMLRILLVPLLKYISKKRVQEIKALYNLNFEQLPLNKIINVDTVNNDLSITAIIDEKADLIIVNGTRIISSKVLLAIGNVPIVNTHLGITPNYRGSHSGYWSLVNNEPNNFGITIHKVDSGIDTGSIIKQQTCGITPKDNYYTYPFLQIGIAKTEMIDFLIEFKKNKEIRLIEKKLADSKLYYNPTIFEYFYNLISKKVK